MKLAQAIELLVPHLGDAVVVMANGYISRAGHALGERSRNFYMIGSMGLASSIGLGMAIARPQQKVVVFDGDGNVLMNLGGVATVAARQPANFHHVVFDNEAYASTGNQPTLTSAIDLAAIARAAGYARVDRFDEVDALADRAANLFTGAGPSFDLIKVEREKGTAFGRVEITPEDMTRRVRESFV